MADLGNQQASGEGPTGTMAVAATPGAGGATAVDKSIVCPAALVGKLIGPAGATIKKLAADSGAQINMDSSLLPGGGKAVIITAADPGARERAKSHVNNWIKENQAATPAPSGGGAPSMQPPSGAPPMRPDNPMGAQNLTRPPMGGGMGGGMGGMGGGM